MKREDETREGLGWDEGEERKVKKGWKEDGKDAEAGAQSSDESKGRWKMCCLWLWSVLLWAACIGASFFLYFESYFG